MDAIYITSYVLATVAAALIISLAGYLVMQIRTVKQAINDVKQNGKDIADLNSKGNLESRMTLAEAAIQKSKSADDQIREDMKKSFDKLADSINLLSEAISAVLGGDEAKKQEALKKLEAQRRIV